MYGTYTRLGVHVWAPDIHVVRAARALISERARRSREHREARHRFYREMLTYHHKSQMLCHVFSL